MKKTLPAIALAATTAALLAWSLPDSDLTSTLEYGTPEMKSVGALAFGPENILFIGDTHGAAVFAVDVADGSRDRGTDPIQLGGVDRRIAQLLGTSPDGITIHDMAVHPTSQNVYMSVSRGSGADAVPLLMRATKAGHVEQVTLENIRFSKAEITNAPDMDAVVRRAPARTFTVTDLTYVDGQVYVAGLSNEDFASNLRRIPFPFNGDMNATSLEIYHVSHGQDETHAPVQTFTAMSLDGETQIVAAYTCTPLVTFGVNDLRDGAHVVGNTIAELGAGNRPLDILPYEYDGQSWIVIANSRHPMMKLDPSTFAAAKHLVNPTKEAGVPFTELATPGVVHLADLNGAHLVAMQRNGESLDIVSLPKASL